MVAWESERRQIILLLIHYRKHRHSPPSGRILGNSSTNGGCIPAAVHFSSRWDPCRCSPARGLGGRDAGVKPTRTYSRCPLVGLHRHGFTGKPIRGGYLHRCGSNLLPSLPNRVTACASSCHCTHWRRSGRVLRCAVVAGCPGSAVHACLLIEQAQRRRYSGGLYRAGVVVKMGEDLVGHLAVLDAGDDPKSGSWTPPRGA